MSELTLQQRRDALRDAMAIIAAEAAMLAEETPLAHAGYRVDQRRRGAAWKRGTAVYLRYDDALVVYDQVTRADLGGHSGDEARIVELWEREEVVE